MNNTMTKKQILSIKNDLRKTIDDLKDNMSLSNRKEMQKKEIELKAKFNLIFAIDLINGAQLSYVLQKIENFSISTNDINIILK